MKEIEKIIIDLTEQCLEQGQTQRREVKWLKEVYDRFRIKNGSIGKAEADRLLYMKMYAAVPGKTSDTLKIRYWRTGRHLPTNREQCVSFGRALDLSEEELKYMIQAYYDRSDCVFISEESCLYKERIALMEELTEEYLKKVHPLIKMQLYREGAGLEHSLRHLYYTDARSYLEPRTPEETELDAHIASINYESEFSRQMKLLGEIPRKTMMRHLLMMGNPFISRELINERLERLGYLPLDEEHSQVDGSRLDKLVLGLLELYEQSCREKIRKPVADGFGRRMLFAILI